MELSILCISYISCNPSCCEGKADCSHQPWAWSAFATKTLNCPAFLFQSCGILPIACSSDETHFSVSCVLFTEAICLSHVAEWGAHLSSVFRLVHLSSRRQTDGRRKWTTPKSPDLEHPPIRTKRHRYQHFIRFTQFFLARRNIRHEYVTHYKTRYSGCGFSAKYCTLLRSNLWKYRKRNQVSPSYFSYSSINKPKSI